MRRFRGPRGNSDMMPKMDDDAFGGRIHLSETTILCVLIAERDLFEPINLCTSHRCIPRTPEIDVPVSQYYLLT